MNTKAYYQTESLFKTLGGELKNLTNSQSKLNNSGLMIKGVVIQASLMPTSSLEKIKFSSNDDLFLSGSKKPSYLKIKMKMDAVTRS